jgi:hypothetical protein
MSMQWGLPDPPEKELLPLPPVWIYVVAFVVFLLGAALMALVSWQKETPTMSVKFFSDIFFFPGLLCAFFCTMLYYMCEFERLKAAVWNIERGYYFFLQQRWARQTLAILGSSSITPEVELAERMLGLEGSMPMNPDKAMVLPDIGAAVGGSRLQKVLETLLTPLVGIISSVTPNGTFDIAMQSPKAEDSVELQRVWGKVKLPGTPEIVWSAYDSAFPAADWIDSKQLPDFRLVIAWQLHEPGQDHTFSEAATALLLANPKALDRWKGKLKPQAHLYRPIVAESDAIGAGLTNLLKGQQTPIDRIKYFWLSRLNRLTRHASKEAIKDSGLLTVEHDLDHAIGKPGPVNTWLLQALAAEMSQHGQGAQLVAVSDGKGVSFNLISSAPTPVPVSRDERISNFRVSIPLTVFFMASAAFYICLPDPRVSGMDRLVIFIMCVAVLAFSTYGGYLGRRRIERAFWTRYG